MKRSFEQMSAMDTSGSGGNGVRKRPPLRRQPRMTMMKRGPALSSRQKAQVKRLVDSESELKYIAFSSGAATSVTSTMNISNSPFAVPQGVTDSERVGDSLKYCGTLEFRYQCVCAQGATGDVYDNIRIVIFQWHPNSTPIASSVFLTGPSGSVDIFSTYSHDNRQLFRVLYDKTHCMVGQVNAAITPATEAVSTGVIHAFIPMKPAQKHTQFAGGGATGTNLIYIALVSDSSAATHPTITYQSKLFFRDA